MGLIAALKLVFNVLCFNVFVCQVFSSYYTFKLKLEIFRYFYGDQDTVSIRVCCNIIFPQMQMSVVIIYHATFYVNILT